MRKIALHWQILIALIVAIIYGLSFPTSYEINQASYKKLSRNYVPLPVQQELSSLEGKQFETLSEFLTELEKLPYQDIEPYKTSIIKAAYYNPPISYISWMGDILFVH